MKRARKTADILAAGFGNGIEVIEEQGLKEQDFGLWEGQTLSEVRTEFPGAIEEQEKKGWQFCPPRGEPRLVVLERSMASLERIAALCRGGRVLLVIHNSVMKLLIYRMLGRKFLPGEPALLKDHHLHWAFRDSGLGIDRLNALALDRVKINDVNG